MSQHLSLWNDDPRFGRSYLACTFFAVTELLWFLEEHDFSNYIASGGGRDFMRPVTKEMCGIAPEAVIGSSAGFADQEHSDSARIVHLAQPDIFDDCAAKPVRIWRRIGRHPVLSLGNSNGAIPMLHYCANRPGTAISLLLDHDDAAREYADTVGAKLAHRRAVQFGWTVVSIARHWPEVFAA